MQKWVEYPFLTMTANANAIVKRSVWTDAKIWIKREDGMNLKDTKHSDWYLCVVNFVLITSVRVHPLFQWQSVLNRLDQHRGYFPGVDELWIHKQTTNG